MSEGKGLEWVPVCMYGEFSTRSGWLQQSAGEERERGEQRGREL